MPHDVTGGRTRARLEDVARTAGVSKATASKALNGQKDVSARTRARVAEVARELSYAPRATSRRTQRRSIVLVADNLSTFYTLEVIKGAVTAAMAEGIGLETTYTPPEGVGRFPAPLTPAWLATAEEHGWIGIIVVTSPLAGGQINAIRKAGLPLVAIDPANATSATVTSIGATNWNGGVEATQHLIGLGHRRIAYVRGPSSSVPSTERLQGYFSALQMNGLSPDSNLVLGSDFTFDSGLEAGRELLTLPPTQRPTAVFAACDVVAFGVYEAAREAGLSVPGNLSIVGFDDTELARLATPRLTTVHQPLFAMGQAAVRTVIALDRGTPTTTGPIRLETHLVLRDSTRRLPEGL